jgi:hypothetical protein
VTRRLLATAAAAGLVAAPAAPAAEPWGPPSTVVASRATVAGPAVAVGPGGVGVAAWSEGDRAVRAARRTARRGFGNPFGRARAGDEDLLGVTVGFDARARAFFAWQRETEPDAATVESRTLRPDGRRSVLRALGEGRLVGPRPAGGVPGRPVLLVRRRAEPGVSVVRPGTGSFDAPVPAGLPADAVDVAIAVEPDGGELAVLVTVTAGGRLARVVAARRAPGEAVFGPPAALTDGERYPREVALDVAADGRATAVWTESSGAGEALVGAVRPAAAAPFAPARELVAPRAFLQTPRVAYPAGGEAVVAFGVRSRGPAFGVGAGGVRVLAFAGARPQPLAADGVRGELELVAGGADGAVAGWRDERDGSVRVATIGPGARIGTVQRLTARGERAGTFALAAAPDRGDALAVWTSADRRRVRSARRPD